MRDPRVEKLAQVLVEYSVAVRKGDLVRIRGGLPTEPLVTAIFREIIKAGGHPFVRMTPSLCEEIFLTHADEHQLEYLNPISLEEEKTIDCDIALLGRENTKYLSNVEPSKQAIVSSAKKPIYDISDQREAENSLRWVVSEFPANASAQDAEMSLSDYEDFVFFAAKVDLDDPVSAWSQQRDQQELACEFMNGVRELHFTANNGTNLSMAVEGRKWINCHGRRNFPDGEVYSAPHEDSTNGVIRFDYPAIYGGREVDGVQLEFQDGKVINASATKGEEFLIEMLDHDSGARTLGEIGIGTNYSIRQFSKNILFDEKIGGTFHTALGASYPKSGGQNESALHWDMVCDLRKGGRITADGECVNESGRFQNSAWPQPVKSNMPQVTIN